MQTKRSPNAHAKADEILISRLACALFYLLFLELALLFAACSPWGEQFLNVSFPLALVCFAGTLACLVWGLFRRKRYRVSENGRVHSPRFLGAICLTLALVFGALGFFATSGYLIAALIAVLFYYSYFVCAALSARDRDLWGLTVLFTMLSFVVRLEFFGGYVLFRLLLSMSLLCLGAAMLVFLYWRRNQVERSKISSKTKCLFAGLYGAFVGSLTVCLIADTRVVRGHFLVLAYYLIYRLAQRVVGHRRH